MFGTRYPAPCMRTYERSTHTAALTLTAAPTAISATVSNGHSGLVWVTLGSDLPLARTQCAEVLHTQPANAALTRSKLLHMLSCPS